MENDVIYVVGKITGDPNYKEKIVFLLTNYSKHSIL